MGKTQRFIMQCASLL